MPKLYYQGHGSYRLTANDGRVIYVDPCAKLIGAKHNIPVHMNPRKTFDKKKAVEKWNAPNKLIVEPGQEIDL